MCALGSLYRSERADVRAGEGAPGAREAKRTHSALAEPAGTRTASGDQSRERASPSMSCQLLECACLCSVHGRWCCAPAERLSLCRGSGTADRTARRAGTLKNRDSRYTVSRRDMATPPTAGDRRPRPRTDTSEYLNATIDTARPSPRPHAGTDVGELAAVSPPHIPVASTRTCRDDRTRHPSLDAEAALT